MYKLRTVLIKVLKIVLSLGVLLFCISPFLPNGKFELFKNQDLLSFSDLPWILIPLVLVFTLINFGLESYKWKQAANHCQNISFKKALKGVLVGSAISSVFPWRTGEFIGKVAYLEAENRVKGTYLSIYSSMTQFFMTLILGFVGFLLSKDFYYQHELDSFWIQNLPYLVLVFTVVLVLFLFVFRNRLWNILFNIAGPRLRYYFRGAKTIPIDLTLRLLLLSFLRYASFIVPYILILSFTETGIDIGSIVVGLSVIFLIQTLIPGFLLSDLPIKGLLHIVVLMPFVVHSWSIGNAVLLVFVCNQVLPAVIGLLLLLTDKDNLFEK